MQPHIFNNTNVKERIPEKYGQQALRLLVKLDKATYLMARR
jgi:hypothetical protein